MQQIINLYQVQFRESRTGLSAKDSLILLSFAVLIMAGLSVQAIFTADNNTEHLGQVKTELAEVEREIASIKVRLDAQLVDPQLIKSVQQLETHYSKKQEILGLIKKPLNTPQSRFSVLLEGLARQHVSGMWLTHIDVHTGGSQLSLQGSTLQAGLIPEFVARLNRETAYEGREFKKMTMDRALDNAARIDFVLTTEQPEKTDNKVAWVK